MKLSSQAELLILGHPLLFDTQPEITVNDILSDDVQHNLAILKKRQIESNGIGLAAPQIGWPAQALSLCVAEQNRSRYPNTTDIPFSFWINPTIEHLSQSTCWAWEGCLSVPGMRAWVERPGTVTLKGFDEHGKPKEKTLTGFAARVLLHELDHLNGMLLTLRVSDPHLIVPADAMSYQADWAKDWPTPNAAKTPPGEVCLER